jgi:hypothetical protein
VTVRSIKQKWVFSIPDLHDALIKLPVEAWPYGRVVALRQCSIGIPGDEQVGRQRYTAVEAVLKALGVLVNGWPA